MPKQAHQAGESVAKTGKCLVFVILPDGYAADLQDAPAYDQARSDFAASFCRAWSEDRDRALYDLAFQDPALLDTPSGRFFAGLARHFINQLAKSPESEFLRERQKLLPDAETARAIIDQAPFMLGLEYLSPTWLERTWRRLGAVYAGQIQAFAGTVAEYLLDRRAAVQPVGRVFFHLVERRETDPPFAFLATYAAGLADGKVRHLPLKNALIEYQADEAKLLQLLSTVYRAAESSPFTREVLDSGEIFSPLGLSADDAYRFLREIPQCEAAGILCRMPDWWKRRTSSTRLTVSVGAKQPAALGSAALIDCQVSLMLGDQPLTLDELRRLMIEAEGLQLIKGKWVEVDHKKLSEALQAYEQAQKLAGSAGLSLVEAMRLQLGGSPELDKIRRTTPVEITQGDWLRTLLQRLAAPAAHESASPGEDFRTQLRPYQQHGLVWLGLMKSLGLGACLADDMGLGKTVQLIALLNGLRGRQAEKALLVIPASLIGNWKRELERFAPSLSFQILHPSEKSVDNDVPPESADVALTVTTYGMLGKYAWLNQADWHAVILDEAQAIKNPATRQTRAVKQIPARWRVALTGTPIENHLSDLWSLFDFLNCGLLGSARSFTELTNRLQANGGDYTRLRQVLSPFILRRLKTDPAIIDDLPDKVEMKTYAGLSRRQAALYQSLVERLKEQLVEGLSNMERRGLVLASILKFKQICNHPDQYLGQAAYQEKDSGKFARLREICETIAEKRERVLVFTQFREMTGPLQTFLESVFAHRGLVLHGQTPVGKRRDIVETFQGEDYVPFLVLSIKAGGVGLNLTAANHVIHFDRWWNPAVENQATDRAFRIGQQKNVIVHKFITSGTIEEKIDRLIEDKSSLAREIVPDQQEAWITELDNTRLIELFSLSGAGEET
jgi:non-specific serine/threonine protein kinase